MDRAEWIAQVEHCDHRPDDDPEPGDRCKDCGVRLTWIGGNDWEPAMGWKDLVQR